MECKNEHFRHILLFYFRKRKNAVLKDERRCGRPNQVDDDQIKAIIESDGHVTVQEFAKMLKIPKSTIDRHI